MHAPRGDGGGGSGAKAPDFGACRDDVQQAQSGHGAKGGAIRSRLFYGGRGRGDPLQGELISFFCCREGLYGKVDGRKLAPLRMNHT